MIFKSILIFFWSQLVACSVLYSQNELGYIYLRILSENDSAVVKNADLEFRERDGKNSFCVLFTDNGGEVKAKLPCLKEYFITIRHPDYIGRTNKLIVKCLDKSKRIDFVLMKQPRCSIKESE